MHKSSTPTIIGSLRILVNDIQSEDGIANMAIAEAADRMEEMQTMIDGLSDTIDSQKQTHDALRHKLEQCEDKLCAEIAKTSQTIQHAESEIIRKKASKYEGVLQYLLHQSGHKDGTIGEAEMALIEKALSPRLSQ